MKRKGYVLSVAAIAWIGIMSWVVTIHPQARQGQVPPAPGQQPPAQAAPGGGGGARGGGTPGSESGWSSFQTRCSICHSNPGPNQGPTAEAIRLMTPEKIFESLTTGKMKMQAEGIAEPQLRRIAEFMAGRPLGSSGPGDAKNMPNKCANNPTISSITQTPAWNSWGIDNANTRFQAARGAGLTAAQVPNLKLKWAFGFPAGETSSSQPIVAAGRVFVGSDNGYIYSLDANTGCVYWSFEGGSIVRGALAIGPVTGQGNARFAVFFGDGHANVYAVNAQDGRMLWKTKVDPHVVARITSGSKFYDGKLIVPVSSSEEFSSGNAGYPCCTSRGSVVALDANTGKEIWKAWVVPGDPKPVGKNPNGVTIYAPGGGGVWNTPTIDTVRNAVYVGTGDATTAPSPKTTDAIMAVDLKTGDLLWSFQADENDVFMGGCGPATDPNRSLACPNPNGPDLDISVPPVLKTLPNGKRVLISATKRGHVFGLDPDNGGKVLYRVLASTGAPPPANAPAGRGSGGTIIWGGAADDQNVYFGAQSAGLTAMKLGTGERAWSFAAPAGGRGNFTAPPSVLPGVVFGATTGGMLYAVSAADGKQLWEYNTTQTVTTVNRVPAHGGAINSTGATIANGMVFITSGYAISAGASGGNVLLAFGVN